MKNSSRENSTLGSVDRISALPDSILGIILSNLRTKKAVATSSLSKRWKFVWRTVYNLDFRHEACWGSVDKDEVMRFVRFVDCVLLQHDGGLLNKFCLVWRPYCILSHASSWISRAITRNVHELCVRVDILLEPYGIPEPFKMPMSVFSCASLQSLELNGGISLPDAIVVCLPRLETLKLVEVYFRSQKDFQKLISGCPMLNYLHLDIPSCDLGCFGQDGHFTYMISSTSLRRLSIKYGILENEYGIYISLVLDASSLEYFKLVGFMLDIAVQKRLSSLVEADLRGRFNHFPQAYICDSIIQAVRVFDCAKALTLSADVMWALSYGTISLSSDFKRLVKLETKTYCCSCDSLQDFIQCSDSLEVLTIHKCLMNLDDENDHDHSNWTAPVEVPRCLLTTLKKVVLEGYYGFEDEREMIRYMLKHGSVLEVMEISCHRNKYREKTKLLQEIREFPRKSPACEVKFFE